MLKDNIQLIFSLTQCYIHDHPPDADVKDLQDTLDFVKMALDDIQLDNSGQYVIYTAVFEKDEDPKDVYGEHVWKGSSISDNCSLCGCSYRDSIHQ